MTNQFEAINLQRTVDYITESLSKSFEGVKITEESLSYLVSQLDAKANECLKELLNYVHIFPKATYYLVTNKSKKDIVYKNKKPHLFYYKFNSMRIAKKYIKNNLATLLISYYSKPCVPTRYIPVDMTITKDGVTINDD